VGDKNGVKGYGRQSVVRINSGEGATANRRREREGARTRLSRELGRDSSESSFVSVAQLQMATRPRKRTQSRTEGIPQCQSDLASHLITRTDQDQ